MDTKIKFRTNFFSNPAVQGKIVLVFLALTALMLTISWVIALHALNTLGMAVMELPSAHGASSDIQLLMDQQRTVLISQLTVYTVLASILVLLGTILISHHIGGPLYHLVSYCRGVARGETKPREIHFRKHDIPVDVADAFNEFQRHHGIIQKADAGAKEAKQPPA